MAEMLFLTHTHWPPSNFLPQAISTDFANPFGVSNVLRQPDKILTPLTVIERRLSTPCVTKL
jgi:hypothetical protein